MSTATNDLTRTDAAQGGEPESPLGPYAFVSHETAVEAIWTLAAKHWQGVLSDEDVWMVPAPEICVRTQRGFRRLAEEVDLRSLGIRRCPADLLVPNKACYSRGMRARFHVWRDFFPPRSFVRVHERVFVSSPYFAVLQLATAHRANRISREAARTAAAEDARIRASLGIGGDGPTMADLVRWENIARFVRAAQVLSDFSGTYRYVPSECAGMTDADVVFRTKPMMSPSSFMDYVGEMPRSKGVERGRAVADAAFFMCASPMETMLALMLTLPVSMGGFGMPRPLVNWEVPLEPRDLTVCSQASIIGDLCWPDQRVVIEYNGWDDHFGAGPHKVASDANRANSLTAMGWKVFQVSFEQVKTLDGVSLLARQLQRALCCSSQPPSELESVWRMRLLAMLLPRARRAW